MTNSHLTDVAIVGGGFTGAAVAYHLAHFNPAASITVFEPRAVLGGGLAYDDHDPAHRINVPAARMSLIPGDETHFARWLADTDAVHDDPEAVASDGAVYPRRGVFGRYVAAHVHPLVAEGYIAHIQARVRSLRIDETGDWIVTPEAGAAVRARIVVLATTHPAPDLPAALASVASNPRLIADPLQPGALASIGADERVVIVGTGLTMADVVASLDRQGHRGSIVAVSRRGLRSRGHPKVPSEPFGDFTRVPERASDFLHEVRRTIRAAEAAGGSWHGVLDAIRGHAQDFWPTLSLEAQGRLVRHLRVYWDVHRFRIAPQVEAVLDRRTANGSLRLLAGAVVDATQDADHLAISVRPRRLRDIETIPADRVVVTTGPAHAKILKTQPFLADLAHAGSVVADSLGLGLACDAESRALDLEGHPNGALFVAGPLARARFGELMGLPQVSAHALGVAQGVSRFLYSPGPSLRRVAEAI